MTLEGALEPLRNELWRLEREFKKLPQDYSVAILGLGRIGQRTFIDLTDTSCIKNFFLVSRDPKKLEGTYSTYIREKDINVEPITYEQLPNCVGDIDIAVICVDASNYIERFEKGEMLSRLDVLYSNIAPIKMVAHSLRGFNGHTIIVTNPVDIIAYLFAFYSDVDPSQVTGLNHTDTMRLVRVIRNELLPGKVKDKDIEMAPVEAYALGPHTRDYIIPIFKSFGGIPAYKLRWYNEENFSRVRKMVDEYGFKQISLGVKTTEETAQAIREIVKAIINQGDKVTASVFIEPKYLGFMRPELPGLFTGYPIKFEGFRAIPRLDDFIIESQFDQTEFVKGYNYLESIISRIEKEEIIKGRVERSFAIDTFFETKQKERKEPIIIIPKYQKYDLELRILGASDDQILQWSPNDPNNPELLSKNPDRHTISSLLFREFKGERLLFVGSRSGIYVIDYDSKILKKSFEHIGASRINSIDTILGDELIVLGTSGDGLFLWKDGKKPFKQFVPQERLNHVKAAKIGKDYNIFVAGEKIYQLEPNNLELLMTYADASARIPFTHLIVSGSDLFASHHDIIRFNINHPVILSRYKGPIYRITSFEKASIDGLRCLIAGSEAPDVMLWLEDYPKKAELVYKKEGLNGISKVKVIKSGANNFILGAESTSDKGANINIWEFNMPEEPRTILTGADYSIHAMEVIRG